MKRVIAAATIIFIFVSFVSVPQHTNLASFFVYYLNLVHFLVYNGVISILGVIFLFALVLLTGKSKSDVGRYQKWLQSLFRLIQILLLGSLIAYVLLFLIALFELNMLAALININPEIAGIESNRNTIAKSLEINGFAPKVFVAGSDSQKKLIDIALASTGYDNFYSQFILPSIPGIFVLPTNFTDSGIILIDNALIIEKLDTNDLETISPIVGYLLVSNFFSNRNIRFYPNIEVLTKQNYLKYRTDDFKQKIAALGTQISRIDSIISSMSAQIKDDKLEAENQNEQTQADSLYKRCLSVGYYRAGIFTRFYADSYCQNLKAKLNSEIKPPTNISTDWNRQLQRDEDLLVEYQYYSDMFKTQKKALLVSAGNIPRELGSFKPVKTIKLEYYSSSSFSTTDYLEVLTHEYLHYASFAKENSLQDGLFEEGLTEYFARRIIKENLGVDTNLGYPVYVKIITEMTKLIPESEFADIYFAKNEAQLEQTLDRVYGENFYENNQIIFETLQYASKPDQILTLANKIMKQIGGKTLSEKDLTSTPSRP